MGCATSKDASGAKSKLSANTARPTATPHPSAARRLLSNPLLDTPENNPTQSVVTDGATDGVADARDDGHDSSPFFEMLPVARDSYAHADENRAFSSAGKAYEGCQTTQATCDPLRRRNRTSSGNRRDTSAATRQSPFPDDHVTLLPRLSPFALSGVPSDSVAVTDPVNVSLWLSQAVTPREGTSHIQHGSDDENDELSPA